VGVDMRACSSLNFKGAKHIEVEKLAQKWAGSQEPLVIILNDNMLGLQITGDDPSCYLITWEGERYHEATEELIRAIASLLEEGGCMEGTLNSDDKFMWKVINGKLVDMVHVELWFEPGKVAVCPECGTPLDIRR
jgi:hypothetical protein